jgi:protein-disulfide isomerase
MLARLLAVLALVLSAWTGPAAAQNAPVTPEQRRAIEEVVRDYLLRNPGVLREAFDALERQERENQAAAQIETIRRNADRLFRTGQHAVLGNPNGDVTIVEFFDYNCGFCRRAHEDMRELLRTDTRVRWVLKEFPVLGPASVEAAQVSAQLIRNPRFQEFHHRLLSDRGQVGRDRAMAVARELSLDVRAIEAGLATETPRRVIQEAYGLATDLNIGGTPTYVIGEEVIVGAVGIEQLRERVANMRRCGRTSCG